MAYKKYIRKNGKLYGPYVYQSKRVGDKVVSEYIGTSKHSPLNFSKNKNLLIAGIILLGVGLLFTLNYTFNFTGNVVSEFYGYSAGNLVGGEFELILNSGELIPADAKVILVNNGSQYNFSLSQLVEQEKIEGDYYLSNLDLGGSGEGYGFVGESETIEDVFFKLKVSSAASKSDSNENNLTEESEFDNKNDSEILTEDETLEDEVEGEESELIDGEILENGVEEESEKEIEELESEEEISGSILTGNVVSGIGSILSSITGNAIEDEVIQGDVSKGNEFTEVISGGSSVELVSDSVRTETSNLDDSVIDLEIEENKVTVTTNYSIIEIGFGEDYLTSDENILTLDFSLVNLDLVEGEVSMEISYNNLTLIDYTGEINFDNVDSLNESVEEEENDSVENLADELFNETSNVSSVSLNINLSSAEKKVLGNEFGLIVVTTSAADYRDKIIVNFSIGEYSTSNAYPSDLNEAILNDLISRDKVLWLKDIYSELSSSSSSYSEREDLASMDTF
jgi:hypothetical protein